MSREKGFVDVVKISDHTVKELARKGWVHHEPAHSFPSVQSSPSSSENEFSISCSSSPGCKTSMSRSGTKVARCVVTKLDFNDCVLNKNKVPRASVKRVVKPLGSNDNDNVLCISQNTTNRHAPSTMEEKDYILLGNRAGLSNEDECISFVPESPVMKSGYECVEVLHLNQIAGVSDDSFLTLGKNEAVSQEIVFTPPRWYRLQNCELRVPDVPKSGEDTCSKQHEASTLEHSKHLTKSSQVSTSTLKQTAQQFLFASNANLDQDAETEHISIDKGTTPSADMFACFLPESSGDLIALDSSQTPKYNITDVNKSPILGSKSRSSKKRKYRRKHGVQCKHPGDIQAVNVTPSTHVPAVVSSIDTDEKENTLVLKDSTHILVKHNDVLEPAGEQCLTQNISTPQKSEVILHNVKSDEHMSNVSNDCASSPRIGFIRNNRKKGKRKLNLKSFIVSPKVLCARDDALVRNTNDLMTMCGNREDLKEHNLSVTKPQVSPMKGSNTILTEFQQSFISQCADMGVKPNTLLSDELQMREFPSISVERICSDKEGNSNYAISSGATLICNSGSLGNRGAEHKGRKIIGDPNVHTLSNEGTTHNTSIDDCIKSLQLVSNISARPDFRDTRISVASVPDQILGTAYDLPNVAVISDLGAQEGKLSVKAVSELLGAAADDCTRKVAKAEDIIQHMPEEEANSSLVIENASSEEERELGHKETNPMELCCVPIISQASSPGVQSGDSELHITPSSEPHTPLRHKFPPQEPPPDSGKKRKRLKKGGLAARLQRLLARRQAAAQLSRYEQATGLRAAGGVVLSVQRVWLEHGRLLAQCSPVADSTGSGSGEGAAHDWLNWLLVLPPSLLPLAQLAHCPLLRVRPPWQTLCVPRLGLMLLLGLTQAELLPAASAPPSTPALPAALAMLRTETFHCLCLDRPAAEAVCTHRLPSHGSSLLQLLFPVLSCSADDPSAGQLQAVSPVPSAAGAAATVAEAVARHSQGLPGNHSLSLRLLRVCCCRPAHGAAEAVNEPPSIHGLVWSVLGQDSTGECCEVVLGSPQEGQLSRAWLSLTTGTALNCQFEFSGLAVARRVASEMVPGLQGLLAGLREQQHPPMFFYVFSAVPEAWSMVHLDPNTQLSPLLQTETLSDIQTRRTRQPSRHTLLARVLAHTDSALYLADGSLSRGSVRLAVQPCVQVPGYLLGRVLYACDVLHLRGELVADKYCRLLLANASDMPPAFRRSADPSAIAALCALSPDIPCLDADSQPGDLVTVTGPVQGVDEASALQWPVCAQCGRDLQEQRQHRQLLCPRCGLAEPRTRFALDVFLPGPGADRCLRVKLRQDTIAALLPPALSESGCDVASMLGRPLGPLLCVLQATGAGAAGHTTLQELPPLQS